jgi:hypothetical protein
MRALNQAIGGTAPWDRGANTIDGLQVLLDAPNMTGANCVGAHKTFDPRGYGDSLAQRQALQCPHLAQCKQWAPT